MPLEHILRAMQAQADREIERIAHAAETEAVRLIAEAETAGQGIRERHRARVEPMLITEAAGLQSNAKLAVLRAMADAREQVLGEAFARAEKRLARIRETKEYPALFRALAVEAIQAFDGHRVAQVDPRDVALARAVFAETGMSIDLEAVAIPLGGLQMRTGDARIIIDNTLAARLERARSILRGPVARIVTGPPASSPMSRGAKESLFPVRQEGRG